MRSQPDLEVVARNDVEAVVYKPAGLSSERTQHEAGPALDSLVARARTVLSWPEARLPHRLDRPTRGLVMISRDAASAAAHAREQREGRWTKLYFARVPLRADGRPATALVGPQKAYLRREGQRAIVVRSGGDPARLDVLAVEPATDRAGEAHALVLLDTGRFHQIRAMLAHLGFPLVGDDLYRGGHAAQPSIDLEAVALRIARDEGTVLHRLKVHPDRRGVAPGLERALDRHLADGEVASGA